ncbi:LysR family transcriptional regulator ArgP [Rhodospirillum rubrum]|uniref:Transcriptional regulator, LysR family n=1 Tax=Rhodospirillum rubrum (strain ATCC 11170 / ATH 1.1.1 / DSM 467 / LMG 4362 / NCIMB 8255 / S1) TaxID=269796 RepID=Q2RWN3_RHORT|nr:LysR family transcriptional regulator ArgP [Rhodospirillum rubrum]ABC21462.1 transcriptional regulator, LysR family [Rhodospirillum rubrum ATCC 11170]AEO47144.1 chromosome replication initiation inhibitor protein [Rhodospirillum rubrum F11]MBK5953056.1 ArgP/LysG family DNA-binding transcriptional regulator [Rhodospirillum rubrum]QXG81137.1 LysR family transcriptional regulator ArgP [Rhodospirillum rubrum]HAP99206.1 LysR family transcriptional regulator ArgP [Rhodospirillum rubrum]
MIDYPAALAVALVVQTGSFEKAAKALHVTPSAISQRVKMIEDRLGVSLIERGTPCIATEKGEWLCRHMDHVGMLEKDLIKHMPGLAEAGADPLHRVTLTLATNADSLGTWFLGAVAPFARSTDFLVSIAVDDEDYTADWLHRGRVLAAVTSLAKPVKGCRVTRLGALRYQATASPEFFERYFARGVTPETLARAPALTFSQKDRLQRDWIRRTLGQSVSFPTHWLPSTQGFVDACLAGMGWGMNPAQMVGAHLQAGRLVEILPGRTLDSPLFWQVNRLAADQLADLTRAVVGQASRALIQPSAESDPPEV